MATQRGYFKEELDRSVANIEMALTHLSRVIEAYSEAHPDIALKIAECGEGLVTIAEVIHSVNEAI